MQAAKRCKILVVEDEGLIAHDISGRVEALGHEVVAIVGTAEEALAQAAESDLILMDINLDGPVDGIEAGAEIRERFHVPVMFLTGQTDRTTLQRATLTEPFGYLVKPLGMAALNTSIEVALHKHKMERALEQREAWLQTTLSSAAEAILVTDVDGRVIMMNRAAEVLSGWIRPEAVGRPVSEILHLTDGTQDELVYDAVPLALLRDSPVSLDRGWQVESRDGRKLMVEGRIAPVKAAGLALGAVLTLRDVSARRWEERQLQQSLKMEAVGRLAEGISRDYSNLLAVIHTQAQHLLEQFGEYTPVREALEQIQQATAAGELITRRLSGLGSRQTGPREVQSLNSILRRMSKLFDSISGQAVAVSLRMSPSAGRVKANPQQIEQAIMNLVVYACTAMPSGGHLSMETANAEIPTAGRMESYVMLAITYAGPDSQPVLDPAKLFEPGSPAESSLALPTVHNIIAEHGGYLSAVSTADAECRFEVFLPRWTETALLPRRGGDHPIPCILLVDPRTRVRSQLHNFLEANGFNLLEAQDALEALAVAELHQGNLDLLVADAAEAEGIATQFSSAHPGVVVLKVVDQAEASLNEIRRPFTQMALLDRISELLPERSQLKSASAG